MARDFNGLTPEHQAEIVALIKEKSPATVDAAISSYLTTIRGPQLVAMIEALGGDVPEELDT